MKKIIKICSLNVPLKVVWFYGGFVCNSQKFDGENENEISTLDQIYWLL